jgi:hypothetical protein
MLSATALYAQEFIGYVKDTINPEDIVLIPDTKWVVASTDNTPQKTKPGYLYIIDSLTGIAKFVDAKIATTITAGEASCKPIQLSHLAISGLSIRTGDDSTHQLMAVNRGERMSIEFFDIELKGPAPVFTWTGCVLMPDKTFPNAVIPISNGGLAVTVSFETDNTELIEQLEQRKNTGYLLEWTKQNGFSRVPGSELPLANGVEVDPNQELYYVSGWGSETLLRIPTLSGSDEPVLTNIGIKPDNLSWSKTGTLIVAGQIQSASKIFKCVASNVDVCSIPFKIIEVDPKTLKTIRVLVDEAAARAYSGATSGLQVGNEIWVSSFRNNKIARYRKN